MVRRTCGKDARWEGDRCSPAKHRLKETRESVDGTLAKMQTRDADLIEDTTDHTGPRTYSQSASQRNEQPIMNKVR